MSNRFEELRGADGILEAYYYYCDNELHREDGPAAVWFYKTGIIETQIWCKNGKIHREDGPAHERFYPNGGLKFCSYNFNSELHREDGPAIERFAPDGRRTDTYYYLTGNSMSEQDYRRQAILRKLATAHASTKEASL